VVWWEVISAVSLAMGSLLNLEQIKINFADNLKQIFYSGEGDALTRDGVINIFTLKELQKQQICN